MKTMLKICVLAIALFGTSAKAENTEITETIEDSSFDELYLTEDGQEFLDADSLGIEGLTAERGRRGDNGRRYRDRDGRRNGPRWGDRRPNHPRRDWRPRHPRRPDYRPRPRPDFHQCYARDRHGITYSAGGWVSRQTLQREAMRKCQMRSRSHRTCRPIGCR